eukprot:m.23256 g.23256  ORF g.23256 m.23256 type:complete len:387 (+) comp14138_c0_seq2:226-1386(+)
MIGMFQTEVGLAVVCLVLALVVPVLSQVETEVQPATTPRENESFKQIPLIVGVICAVCIFAVGAILAILHRRKMKKTANEVEAAMDEAKKHGVTQRTDDLSAVSESETTLPIVPPVPRMSSPIDDGYEMDDEGCDLSGNLHGMGMHTTVEKATIAEDQITRHGSDETALVSSPSPTPTPEPLSDSETLQAIDDDNIDEMEEDDEFYSPEGKTAVEATSLAEEILSDDEAEQVGGTSKLKSHRSSIQELIPNPKWDAQLLKDHPMAGFALFVRQNRMRVLDLFRCIDGGVNGKLTYGEIKQALMDLNIPLTTHSVEDLIKHMDLNKDGEINYMEFSRCCGAYTKYRRNLAGSRKNYLNKKQYSTGTGRKYTELNKTGSDHRQEETDA